jgi:hypothetical protein
MSLYIPYVDENVPALYAYKLVSMFDGKKWSNISYICNVVNPITCRSPNHKKNTVFLVWLGIETQMVGSWQPGFPTSIISPDHCFQTHTNCLIIPDAIESEIVYIHLLSFPGSGRTSAIYAADGM